MPDDIDDLDDYGQYSYPLNFDDFDSDFIQNSAEMNAIRAEDLDEIGESSSQAVS